VLTPRHSTASTAPRAATAAGKGRHALGKLARARGCARAPLATSWAEQAPATRGRHPSPQCPGEEQCPSALPSMLQHGICAAKSTQTSLTPRRRAAQDECFFKFQHCARCDHKKSKCVACNAPFAVTPQGHCVCPIGWQAATNQFGETTCLAPGSVLDPLVANITEQITNLTTLVQNITAARPARQARTMVEQRQQGVGVCFCGGLLRRVGRSLPVTRATLCMQNMQDHIAGVLHDSAARHNAGTCLNRPDHE